MSQKRKSSGYLPPNKKFRTDNSTHIQSQSPQVQPNQSNAQQESLPPLPPVNKELGRAVFTHQSFASFGDTTNDLKSYERLEFLGDAYIELMASRLIWETYKTLPTGRMSQIRELLVKNDTLAQFSVMYGFDKRVRSTQNFERTNPAVWRKVKGDIFEAYIAAVILSDPIKGFEVAEDWLTQLWQTKLKDVELSQTDLKAKEALARKIMVKGVKISYVDERPPVVDKDNKGILHYQIGVYLTGWGWENHHLGSGKGLSKVGAGNEAAMRALENKPLIDEIVAKRLAWLEARNGGEEMKQQQQ